MAIKASDVATEETKSLVNSYLMARAYAEATRERVDAIGREILKEMPLYADSEDGGARIVEPSKVFSCPDDEATGRYFLEASKRERAAGIKPANMADEFCPALVAETRLSKIENMLIDASGKALGVGSNSPGMYLERRKRYIDLVVGMVVNMPGFRNPLDKKPG